MHARIRRGAVENMKVMVTRDNLLLHHSLLLFFCIDYVDVCAVIVLTFK